MLANGLMESLQNPLDVATSYCRGRRKYTHNTSYKYYIEIEKVRSETTLRFVSQRICNHKPEKYENGRVHIFMAYRYCGQGTIDQAVFEFEKQIA